MSYYIIFFVVVVVAIAFFASLAFKPLQPKRVYSKTQKYPDKSLGTSKMNFSKDNRDKCECCRWGNKYFPKANEVIAHRDASFEDLDEEYVRRGSMRAPSTTRAGLSTASFTNRSSRGYSCMRALCCGSCQTETRAMYRDDIFYGGSIIDLKRKAKRKENKALTKQDLLERKRIGEEHAKSAAAKAAKVAVEVEKMKQTTSKAKEKTKEKAEDKDDHVNFKEYHMNVTRVTTDAELYEEFQCCCACSCTVSGIRALTTLLDFRIMKSIAFLILSFNGFFFTLGYNIPFMFVVDRATEAGIERHAAVMYLSYIGISNTIARVISGVLPIILNINITVMIIVCCVLQGACTAFSDYYMEHWFQILFVVFYGFLGAPQQALRSVIVVDIFGLENLTNIFGLQLLLSGVAAMIGPTVAGMLRDVTQNFTYSFYFSGACIVFSAFLLCFIRPARNWETRTGFVSF